MKNKILYFSLFSVLGIFSHGQISVSTGQTPQWYVDNVLFGGGAMITNVVYIGDTNSIGMFQTGVVQSSLGLSSGIVLSTGNLNSPLIGSPAVYLSDSNMGQPGYSLLSSLAMATSKDAAVLEISFIPFYDTLRFSYVFASEEYHQWVNSSFNDVMGLYISGPNPSGGVYSNEYFSFIPGTNTPVIINNINNGNTSNPCSSGPCINCAFFIDNCNDSTFVFDGFTTVMEASIEVVPYEPYLLIIGIADAGDSSYDSALFLEAGSMVATGIKNQEMKIFSANVFPNPCHSNLFVEINYQGEKTIILSDISGRTISVWNTDTNLFVFDTSHLLSGFYFVTVNHENGSITKKAAKY